MKRKRFIQLAGIGAALTSGGAMVAGAAKPVIATPVDTYSKPIHPNASPFIKDVKSPEAARNQLHTSAIPISDAELKLRSMAAFDRFQEVWNFFDFWKRGNTFDACLTFAAAVRERWPDDRGTRAMQSAVTEMLRENLVFFDSVNLPHMWADDFGWWGLMALNGRTHLLREGQNKLAADYLHLATELCWEYKRNAAYDESPNARPVPHGCSNADALGQSPGVKNTVTNVLLLLLSSRIYRHTRAEGLTGNERYLEMAYRQWRWFEEWFARPEFGYLRQFAHNAALVEERPLAFFEDSDYQDIARPPWGEGWTWTGDQGMMVASLSDLLALKGDLADWLKGTNSYGPFYPKEFDLKLRHYLTTLGEGIQKVLVGPTDGIIREAPFESSFGPVHGNDYLAGRGIMMRYLADKEIRSHLGVDLREAVHNTVNAIWQTREPSNNQFQPEFTSETHDFDYIAYFRQIFGAGDYIRTWDIATMEEQQKHGVCQSIGLDALGAAIRWGV